MVASSNLAARSNNLLGPNIGAYVHTDVRLDHYVKVPQSASYPEDLLWSLGYTWGGTVPTTNEDVVIASNTTVVLDTVTSSLGSLTINGLLVAQQGTDVSLIASSITVAGTGELRIGTSAVPYTNNAEITLTGARSAHTARSEDNGLDNDAVSRGLRVLPGGKLRLFGVVPAIPKTTLNAHATAGASSFTLADEVDWTAGDEIAIAPTDFWDVGATEFFTLDFDSVASSIQTTSALAVDKWGVLQYPTDTVVDGNAMSLSAGTFTPAVSTCPTVLDERAEVINLTRNIVIQGANDTDWTSSGFGAHTMIMHGLSSVAQLRGVQFKRGGQRQAMGRYPFHWHMMSYDHYESSAIPGGTYLGDAVEGDHFMEGCTVVDSENRAVTIHGTCGVRVKDTFATNIKGHAFFFEDGSEERNVVSGCVALNVRDPDDPMLVHDGRSSGFWLTNPLNKIHHNTAADCEGRGMWNSFAPTCFGLSRNASGLDGSAIEPQFIVIDEFDDNTGHSCGESGLATEGVVSDEAGNIDVSIRYLNRYTNNQEHSFFMRRNKTWKNREDGYFNRVMRAHYIDWTAADNDGFNFKGVAFAHAILSGPLLIASSLNSVTPHIENSIAFASYHFTLGIEYPTVLNYPYASGIIVDSGQFFRGGGTMDQADLYTESIGLKSIYNPGWRLINSHPGFLTPPPWFDGEDLWIPERNGYRFWSLAGAILDPYGYWGASGDFLVVDDPFYTYELTTSTTLDPVTTHVATSDRFVGIKDVSIDTPGDLGYTPEKLQMHRLDPTALSSVGYHELGLATSAPIFQNMRTFTLASSGTYQLLLPDGEIPSTDLSFKVEGLSVSSDQYVMSVPFSGTVPVSGLLEYSDDERILTASGSSLSDVTNDANGTTMWQDTGNNVVWFKHAGGMAWTPNQYTTEDQEVQRESIVYIRPTS